MTTINQLPLLTTLSGGDNLVVWSPNNGDSRRVPYSFVKADIRAGLTLTDLPVATIPLAGTEEMPIVQGGISKRTAINNILNANTIPYIANGLGAVATPSYTFTGDLNTGMWSPDADNIAFSVGGTEAMRIADTGYVGIGTNDPFTTLDMASGFANLAGTVVTDRAVKIGQNRAISTDASLDFHSAGNPSVFNAQFIRYSGVNGNFDLINSGTGNITISANGSERMRVTSAGNVGIGTSSPTSLLDVNGNTEIAGTLFLGASNHGNLGSDATQLFVRGNNVVFQNAAGSATYVYVNSSGNVGIGTASPASKLDVNGVLTTGNITARGDGSEGGQITFNNAANSAGPLTLDVDNLGNGRLFTTVNNANLSLGQLSGTGGIIQFYTANSERMRIDSAGNVGIGTSSPITYGKFAVAGTGVVLSNIVGDNTGEGQLIYHNVTAGRISVVGAFPLIFQTNSNERMRIDSTGSVGIGTSSPDVSALLDVSSTTKGFLPPRMSTAQRDAIGGATQEGLILYNVTTDKLQVFSGGAWVNLH